MKNKQRQKNTMLIFCLKKKWPDKSITSYDLLHFKDKKFVMDISANSTLNIAKVCVGFATYDI